MGILKLMLNANNAEGIREAMRLAYKKQRRKAESGALGSDFSPHVSALVGTMASRMAVNNLPVTPLALWHEVAPFALIDDEEVAVEALAEYAVYVERTVDTKLAGLRETLNSWLRRAPFAHDLMRMVTNPYALDCRWQGLLEDDVIERLEGIRRLHHDIDDESGDADDDRTECPLCDGMGTVWYRGFEPVHCFVCDGDGKLEQPLTEEQASYVRKLQSSSLPLWTRDFDGTVHLAWADVLTWEKHGRELEELASRLGFSKRPKDD